MNKRQHTAMWVGLAFIVVMVVVPPWTSELHLKGLDVTRPAGYALLFAPLSFLPPELADDRWGVKLDIERLSLQVIVTAGITAACVFSLKGRKDG